jgi:hypothetical protein
MLIRKRKWCLNCQDTIGGYLFILPTDAQFLQYYYFTPYTYFGIQNAILRGHSVKSIDYTSIV